MKKLLTLLAMLFVVVQTASSMPAYPRPVEYSLPDGTSITVQLFGDEFFNYMLSSDGYQLTSLGDGFLYYYTDGVATKNATAMRASSPARRTAAERSYVSSLRRGVDATYASVGRAIADQHRPLMKTNASGEYAPFASQATKSQANASALAARSIVILCQYQDVKFQATTTKAAFENLLNQPGYSINGAIGSAKDYFMENSFGEYGPTFDVSEIVTLPQPRVYYGKKSTSSNDSRAREMVVDACKLAGAAGVDFSQYDYDNDGFVDNVFVFYAGHNEAEGGSSESIWPHRWTLNIGSSDLSFRLNGKTINDYACTSELKGASGSTLCGIGTFVHEFGHVLGLPDFYDTDDEGSGGYFPGLYNTCVMNSGGYNDGGNIPPHYTGIERELVGWATMRDLKDAPDILTISPIHTKEGCNTWKIETDVPGEYYYLEARQSTRWDKPITTEGLLIYHIDRSAGKLPSWGRNTLNTNPGRPGARIIESVGRIVADGAFDRMFYPGGGNVTSFLPGSYGFNSWSGNPLPIGLTGISQSNGTVTLRVVKDLELGTVQGTVKDDAGTAIVGVQVSFIEIVENQAAQSNGTLRAISKEQINATRAANVVYTVTTESNGRYVKANLPYAEYDVMFDRAGYDRRIERMDVNAKNTTLDVTLNRFVAKLLSQKSWSSGEVESYLDKTGSIWVASLWNAADLVSVAGKKVGGIAVETASSTTYEARLLINNSLKFTSRGSTVAGGRTIVYLPSMMDITLAPTDEVRIEFKVESAVASIGLDAGPAVKGKGDLYSENGQTWKNLSDSGINSNLAMSLLFFKENDIPEIPSVSTSPSQRSCVLQFSTVDGNITSWNLRYKALDATEWIELPVIKTTAYTLENLTHETTYDAQLEAVFGDKKSELKEFQFKTVGLTAPFAAIGGIKGSYTVGESYKLNSVNIQSEVESTEWRWNGGQIRSESLTFGAAGRGRLDCVITYKDGKKETLSREIVVQ